MLRAEARTTVAADHQRHTHLTSGHVARLCDLVGDDVQQTARKSENIISAIGPRPVIADPMAAPRMACSEIGVTHTTEPNSCSNSTVALNTRRRRLHPRRRNDVLITAIPARHRPLPHDRSVPPFCASIGSTSTPISSIWRGWALEISSPRRPGPAPRYPCHRSPSGRYELGKAILHGRLSFLTTLSSPRRQSPGSARE